jgi:hypothetical protein
MMFNLTRINRTAPKALISDETTTKIGLPEVVAQASRDRFRP